MPRKAPTKRKPFCLNLTERATVRLSTAHAEAIDRAAAALNLDRASFMRMAALRAARGECAGV